VLRKGSVHTAQ